MDSELLARMPSFKRRIEWFIQNRSDLTGNIACIESTGDCEPGESRTGMFGGNSNWRGPIWFPMNFLLVEALQRFHYYYYFHSHFKVECPTGIWSLSDVVGDSGRAFSTASVNLRPVARWLQARLWRRFEISIGHTLARFDSFLRVSSWRRGRGHGLESPNRLDLAGHETDSAEWSQRAKLAGHCRDSGCVSS
jgi:hypothetical protein